MVTDPCKNHLQTVHHDRYMKFTTADHRHCHGRLRCWASWAGLLRLASINHRLPSTSWCLCMPTKFGNVLFSYTESIADPHARNQTTNVCH